MPPKLFSYHLQQVAKYNIKAVFFHFTHLTLQPIINLDRLEDISGIIGNVYQIYNSLQIQATIPSSF